MKTFEVPTIYRSELISAIKNNRRLNDKLKKDYSPTLLDFGSVQLFLARHFGFCYGVENAIEIAFKTVTENADKRIFLLSEMIHNPLVNEHLQQLGVQFLQDTNGNQIIPFSFLQKDDVVLIPAFGTTLEIENILHEKKIQIEKYNTTCPFVEKVWNRSEQISAKGYTVVIHGKPQHEETRATFSHASSHAPTVVVNNMKETIALAKYIAHQKPLDEFYTEFKGKYSDDFDVSKHLIKIGVVNQTTQLATDTQAIADYLKNTVKDFYGLTEENIEEHFADTRDTLCYATNDNQTAVIAMLHTDADFAIVIGGYNSSNTSHLVELCEKKLPAYFIDSAEKIINADELIHCNWRTKEISTIKNFMPKGKTPRVLITSGASCPDVLVEQVIKKLVSFFPSGITVEEIYRQFL